MNSSPPNHVLPELFDALQSFILFDTCDWHYATRFAEKWKLSVADAMLDLHFVDETTLAKALARAHNLNYLSGTYLKCDFKDIDFECFNDLLSVGAAPLEDNRLAICNPYDDHRGNLGNRLCQREMVVTERSHLYETLRRQSLSEWLRRDDEELDQTSEANSEMP